MAQKKHLEFVISLPGTTLTANGASFAINGTSYDFAVDIIAAIEDEVGS